MGKFVKAVQAWSKKTGEKIEDIDRAIKLQIFNNVVKRTRVADPDTWKRPDPTYLGGTMRGNWQVTTGAPALTFLQRRNTAAGLTSDEAAKIRPFSKTFLTNNTPYVRVWEEHDGMVAAAVAQAAADFERIVREYDR